MTTAYSGRVTNWPVCWLVLAIAAGLVAWFTLSPQHPIGVVLGAAAVALSGLIFTTIGVTVGENGVVARFGVLGVPRFRFAMGDIERAEAANVPISRMGGWGLHYSPWRGTRMTVRSGPTLELYLTGGSRVAISATEPATAAAVVNGTLRTTGRLPG